MRKWLAIAIAVGLGATACTSNGGPSPEVPSDIPTVQGKGPKNPFGVLNAVPGLDVRQQVTIAREMGVRYVRPAFPIFAESDDLACVGCEEFAAAGFDLVLTVRNSEDVASFAGSGQPFPAASPPADMAAYKQTITTIIERYRPAVIVVENEEDVLNHYSGTPEQYGEQLRTACEAAHDSGVKCTNGGLLSGSVVDLVYQNYVDQGMDAEAQSFADRAFEEFQTARRNRPGGDSRLDIVIDRGRRLLDAYRGSGADYVNFHWYVADPQAMEEATAYMSQATGLPPMTNEIGQRDHSPDTTVRMMTEVLQLGLPYAVWYLADARLARGLIDRDGSLRPTGEAFREFIRTNS